MDSPKDEAKARELMREYSFPAAFGREMRLKDYGRIWRLPLTFVIDRQGVLRKDGWYGKPLLDAATLEQTVTPLLRGRANSARFAPGRRAARDASAADLTSRSRPLASRCSAARSAAR